VSTAFWAWIVLAVILALAESINADLFMLPWAVGAVVAAVLEALHPSSGWQWLAFFGLSPTLVVLAQRFMRPRGQAQSDPPDEGPLS
jgi:membrane protein implicated in regulation of membrane protease activity